MCVKSNKYMKKKRKKNVIKDSWFYFVQSIFQVQCTFKFWKCNIGNPFYQERTELSFKKKKKKCRDLPVSVTKSTTIFVICYKYLCRFLSQKWRAGSACWGLKAWSVSFGSIGARFTWFISSSSWSTIIFNFALLFRFKPLRKSWWWPSYLTLHR